MSLPTIYDTGVTLRTAAEPKSCAGEGKWHDNLGSFTLRDLHFLCHTQFLADLCNTTIDTGCEPSFNCVDNTAYFNRLLNLFPSRFNTVQNYNSFGSLTRNYLLCSARPDILVHEVFLGVSALLP